MVFSHFIITISRLKHRRDTDVVTAAYARILARQTEFD